MERVFEGGALEEQCDIVPKLISPKQVIEDIRGIEDEDVEDEAEDEASVEEESEGGGKC